MITDNHEQFHEDGSGEFSDETIRRFLLGGLSALEQPWFEQRLLTDDGLATRVRLTEFDLADDYAFERLSPTERNLFQERFLLTSDRRQKLKVSKVLRDRFSSIDAPATWSEKYLVAGSFRDLFGLGRPAWRIAFGVLVAVILLGTAWLVVKEPRIAEQITNRIIPRRSTTPSAPRQAGHPVNTSTPEHQTIPSPMPEHDQTASSPITASVVLMPDVPPGSNKVPSVNLLKGEKDVVRLQLVLKLNQPGPYRAELLTIQGQSVFSVDSLQSANSSAEVDFDVPAHFLNFGDYQIRLSRSDGGSNENVVSYYFRMR